MFSQPDIATNMQKVEIMASRFVWYDLQKVCAVP